MILDLRPIVNAPGERLTFRFELDLADVDFGGVYPIRDPLVVTGEARNTAGMLTLSFEAGAVLRSVCDRCLKRFDQPKTVRREFLLSADPEGDGVGDGGDDVLPLRDCALDVGELAREEFLLGMDTKTLCSEDCKGLCPGCGADLNLGKCTCGKTADPRWTPLRKLLEREDDR